MTNILFQNVGAYLERLQTLTECIPKKNLDAAMQIKGSTLLLVKKRELDEIREKLQEVVNLLSK